MKDFFSNFAEKMSAQKRVLVAMSGGVDSTLAALLLLKKGYEVVGLTMKTWEYSSSVSQKKETGCCSLDAIHDARQAACQMNIPHYVTDIKENFGEDVIDYFVSEYMSGRTPNPCVMCNTHIKWNVLLNKADALGCSYVATGHYAQLRQERERYILSRAKDKAKDQSYALWGVSQEALARTIFPLSYYTKSEIKDLAKKHALGYLADKSESYEICFVPDNNYRSFLQQRVENLDRKVGPGPFLLTSGQKVGEHKGYPFYTIGQRKGLGIHLGYPTYVLSINAEKNEVIVGTWQELSAKTMHVAEVNWVKYKTLTRPVDAQVHIRYNDKIGTPARLLPTKEGVSVLFKKEVHAIAPGQAAVFYINDDLIGGGWIKK